MDNLPIAIFVRVSSKSQFYERQINELQTYADKQGYQVVSIISEKVSASKKMNQDREGIQELLSLAKTGTIKKVLVSEVSRIGRKPSETLSVVEQLNALKISIYCKNMGGMETLLPDGKVNPIASIIISVFAELARYETEIMAERIRSGQADAVRKGKVIGRKKGTVLSDGDLLTKHSKAVKSLREGMSIRQVSRLHTLAKSTVEKLSKIINS